MLIDARFHAGSIEKPTPSVFGFGVEYFYAFSRSPTI